MATIAQIVSFMNEKKFNWFPQDVVSIGVSVERLGVCYDLSDPTREYFCHTNQKFIGHYYESQNHGNGVAATVLLPLNNGRYLKSNIV